MIISISKKRNFILSAIVTLMFLAGLFPVNGKSILLALSQSIFNLSGFSWSDNVGWSEFKPKFGGVSLDMSTGQLSGYAWSDNIGWIYFGPDTDIAKAGDAPQDPKHWAKIDIEASGQTRTVTGWARAFRPIKPEGQTLGGWDGWISMSGTASNSQRSPYSVSLNLDSNEFSGWAWGSDIIGWVSFNCSNGNECAVSNYKVKMDSGLSSSSSSSSISSSSSSSSSSSISSSSSSSSSSGGGGGGGGGSISGGGGTITFGGGFVSLPIKKDTVVATISEIVPEQCEYVKEYLKKGSKNNLVEVLKLQVFLFNYENLKIPITGVFDDATFNAVSIFQKKYDKDVLDPWGFKDPTGWVYYTTRKKINEVYCKKDFPLTQAQKDYIARFKAYLKDVEFGKITPGGVQQKLNEIAKSVKPSEQSVKMCVIDFGTQDKNMKDIMKLSLTDKYLLAATPVLVNGKLMIALISLLIFIPFAFFIWFNRRRNSKDKI